MYVCACTYVRYLWAYKIHDRFKWTLKMRDPPERSISSLWPQQEKVWYFLFYVVTYLGSEYLRGWHPPRRPIKNHFLTSNYILFKVNSKYVVEFTSWALRAGNKIDIWLHKNFPHQFTMQKLSSNLNTVFRTRNQPVRMVRMGALCIGIVWQPSNFLWRQNNLSYQQGKFQWGR